MTATLIDGKALSETLRASLKSEVETLKKKGSTPGLTVVLVGENPASQVYTRNKKKAAEKLGIKSQLIQLPASTSEKELLKLIDDLNKDKTIHGILVQLPLPKAMDVIKVLQRISPLKDVDGFHPENVGRLMLGYPRFESCTPLGIIRLIESIPYDLKGKNAVVVGRSNIVGKPVAIMLLQRHATVTICHSRTQDLRKKISEADVLIAAVGIPEMIKGAWIKKGACVIDVGINQVGGSLKGDVEFSEALERAGWITPVPGGVGPMTIAMLLANTIKACQDLSQC